MAEGMWERAESDIAVRLPSGRFDPLVWEHARRVAHLSTLIASINELQARRPDQAALQAGALYHDAGWIVQLASGEITVNELLLRPTSDVQRELGADLMLRRLKGILPQEVLELAAGAIREMSDRGTRLLEAQVLAEAENLDEIGPQTVQLMVRRQWGEGRSTEDILRTWERQEEYRYWEARLKSDFRFDTVRRIAVERLETLRRYMADLRRVMSFEDIPWAAPGEGEPGAARRKQSKK